MRLDECHWLVYLPSVCFMRLSKAFTVIFNMFIPAGVGLLSWCQWHVYNLRDLPWVLILYIPGHGFGRSWPLFYPATWWAVFQKYLIFVNLGLKQARYFFFPSWYYCWFPDREFWRHHLFGAIGSKIWNAELWPLDMWQFWRPFLKQRKFSGMALELSGLVHAYDQSIKLATSLCELALSYWQNLDTHPSSIAIQLNM